jgi:hypothetical protein
MEERITNGEIPKLKTSSILEEIHFLEMSN